MNTANEPHSRAQHICPWWLAYTFDNPLRRYLHDPHKLLSPYVRKGMIAVDIGCGMGYFSIGLARIVGDAGTVISIDLQKEMLDHARWRAEKAGVAQRILFVRATQGDIGVNTSLRAGFVLGFWMVHEVEDARRFFRQVHSILEPDGSFLIAEPKMHVTGRSFHAMLDIAREAGFIIGDTPSVRWSRAVLLRK